MVMVVLQGVGMGVACGCRLADYLWVYGLIHGVGERWEGYVRMAGWCYMLMVRVVMLGLVQGALRGVL